MRAQFSLRTNWFSENYPVSLPNFKQSRKLIQLIQNTLNNYLIAFDKQN
ncbi:GSCOCG00011643001-RA-CDS [Cotesia congregata]|nr:GSCOCG00011643001-RA-CDS [Cotesia congregata]